LFIKHRATVGGAREEILRSFLRQHIPEPLRIRSGFIHQADKDEPFSSPQLDVVIYDPTYAQPDYQIGEIVVVPRFPAKAFGEVKTDLDQIELHSAADAWDKLGWLALPGFVFAFDGVTFQTFVAHMSEAIKNRPWGVPNIIAVHSRNYIF